MNGVTSDSTSVRFARRVFAIAGIYGLVILFPLLFMERRLNAQYPPAINHPEYFYGFLGVALAWQVLFLIIAKDPVRYRLAMVPSILEKIAYGGACLVLYLQNRIVLQVLVVSLGDFVWAVFFYIAFLRTPSDRSV